MGLWWDPEGGSHSICKALGSVPVHKYSINNSFLLGKQMLFIFTHIIASSRFGLPLARWNPMLNTLFPRVEEVGNRGWVLDLR